MLEIKDLTVNSLDKELLHQVNINIKDGEIHLLIGPNGAGKSTICKSIMHHPTLSIKEGTLIYNGKDITKSSVSEVAKSGIYYISQSPIEIEGITNAECIRTSLLESGKNIDIFSFNKKCNEVLAKLELPKTFLHRSINEGMSGGERKKNELFGMWMLEPSLVILDEIDSGLDIDAIKLVAKNILDYQKQTHASFLVISHQEIFADLIDANVVHLMKDGKVIETGNKELLKTIQKTGFDDYFRANKITRDDLHE